MATLTIRNLPDEIHRALRLRAASHGRSTEVEIRAVLEEAVRLEVRLKLGSTIAALAREFGGVELEIRRDQRPVEPASFE
jgi:antitoxin FitA